jgi:hypothetical protein
MAVTYTTALRPHRLKVYDFIGGGERQLSRFQFLDRWNCLYKATVRACYIYIGWEKSGLWPIDREVVLEPLRRAAHQQTEPLFPNLLHPVTPRQVKEQFNPIRDKLQILSSPTRAILQDVEFSLDYVIIAKSAQKDIVRLQKEKLKLEARRTGTLRRIHNPDGGTYTTRQLREMLSDRAQHELQITNKR